MWQDRNEWGGGCSGGCVCSESQSHAQDFTSVTDTNHKRLPFHEPQSFPNLKQVLSVPSKAVTNHCR